MQENAHVTKKNIIYTIVLIAILIIGATFYSKYSFGNFNKSIREKGKTSFSRDANIPNSKHKSYKIENRDYNDAMFYQTIQVKPNTPYKIKCKVKTENVENELTNSISGAQICIRDTTECSKSIVGSNDWQELTFYFNSKNRTNVDIGFRLGSYEENSKGTAWFYDFTVEEGMLDNDNKWNIACFMLEKIDVEATVNGKQQDISIQMTSKDKQDIKNNMRRLSNTFKELSNGKMDVTYNVFSIKEPVTSISYDEGNEYYIAPNDVSKLIEEYLEKEEYDYIYVATRFGNISNNKEILVHDWIGLGGMDYRGIGFSNIRLPDVNNSYMYEYNSNFNTFPEEVFVHEFLHTMERNEKEYGNTNIISLHAYEEYGYKTEAKEGLKQWYRDYMQNAIKNNEGKTGLTNIAYTSKPIHESNFRYSYQIEDALKEPNNIIEEIISMINRVHALMKG